MTVQQAKANATGYHYRVVAAAVAMLVLLLSFASVSPKLHDWLHAETECAHHHSDDGHHAPEHSDTNQPEEQHDHHCAVTLLSSGTTISLPAELPQRGGALIIPLASPHEPTWYERPSLPQSARGPPTLIVV